MTTENELPNAEATKQLEKKISLTLENKRFLLELEREVEALDWDVSDKFGATPNIALPAEHLLAAGGKRVRPLLVCILARSLNLPFEKVAKCAVAAELVHTATLLHDDILDGATTRRGRMAAHLKYDAHTAILSGDSLLSKAISDMAELRDPEILLRLSNTVRELVEGECLQADLMGSVHDKVESVLEIARRKTASLFAWCGWVTGHRAGGEHAEHLFKFGTHLGLAFQLLDDILDWESTNTGKTRFQDLHEAKLNAVGAKLVELSPKAKTILTESFATLKDGYISEPEKLGDALVKLNEYKTAIAWAKKEAQDHSAFAIAYLNKMPQSIWRELTKQLTISLLERMK